VRYRREDESDAPRPSSDPAGLSIASLLFCDLTSMRTMREGRKRKMSGGVQRLPFFVDSPCLREEHGLLAEGGHPFREGINGISALKDFQG
jgi:hypothetical protein